MLDQLMTIGIVLLSFILGRYGFYFFIKENNQLSMGELINWLMNLVIFMWLGKVILNMPIFLSDPVSILAYPSDSSALFVGLIGSLIIFYIQFRKNKEGILLFLNQLTFIVLLSSAIHYILKVIILDASIDYLYLLITSGIIILMVTIWERLDSKTKFLVLVTCWSFGLVFGLLVFQPYVLIFNYNIQLWFLIGYWLISIVILLSSLSNIKKERFM